MPHSVWIYISHASIPSPVLFQFIGEIFIYAIKSHKVLRFQYFSYFTVVVYILFKCYYKCFDIYSDIVLADLLVPCMIQAIPCHSCPGVIWPIKSTCQESHPKNFAHHYQWWSCLQFAAPHYSRTLWLVQVRYVPGCDKWNVTNTCLHLCIASCMDLSRFV